VIPVELSRQIAARILEARRHHPDRVSADGSALLLYADMGGQCYLRPDGEILRLSIDSGSSPERETDPKFRTVALVAGSEVYPELGILLPVRPPSSRDCEACSGGRVRVGERRMICGECNGLGWQPAA
jgi:hypothetical protein